MNYHDIKHDDMNNGPGLRVTLFVSGCDHYCNGCQNPETWDTKSGIPFDNTAIEEIFEQLDNDYISGITFSGGDPMYQANQCAEIAKYAKKRGLNIWCYTGFKYEDLLRNNNMRDFLNYIDVLVDGKFDINEFSLNLQYKGSRNQRIIDVAKSLEEGEVILIEKYISDKDTSPLYKKPDYMFI